MSIGHKFPSRFVEEGKRKGLPSDLVDCLRKTLVWLDAIDRAGDPYVPPNYGADQLTADRSVVWSLKVSRNWRMTFMISDMLSIEELDL